MGPIAELEQPLTIISNREPYKSERSSKEERGWRLVRTTGGLVSALDAVMRRCRGQWISWAVHNAGHPSAASLAELPYRLEGVPVSSTEVRRYYRGFANSALWPLCHYCLSSCHYQLEDWKSYEAVNRRFARRVASADSSNHIVWVHDYHLCLVPALIRQELDPSPRIAYFHHIPFPCPDVFRTLPWHEEILRGLLGADVVGFHTRSYADNFLQACRRLENVRVDMPRSVVHVGGREVEVDAFPLGVDVGEIDRLARDEKVSRDARRIRDLLGTAKVILGVDRLDYTKGILERLTAFDRFLVLHPEQKRKVSLVQIAVPSRTKVPEYQSIKRRIDEAVGRINGRHGDKGWQPVHYSYRALPMARLVAHYLAADIALVTPIRDGMNLVAKEYCAARIGDDGVLILSEFAGAAECLAGGALIVNPYDCEQIARVLGEAMSFSAEEQGRRMRIMRARIKAYDIHAWLADILSRVLKARRNAGYGRPR
jgi:trehalose 6-phosphate synthase/phosphatase